MKRRYEPPRFIFVALFILALAFIGIALGGCTQTQTITEVQTVEKLPCRDIPPRIEAMELRIVPEIAPGSVLSPEAFESILDVLDEITRWVKQTKARTDYLEEALRECSS